MKPQEIKHRPAAHTIRPGIAKQVPARRLSIAGGGRLPLKGLPVATPTGAPGLPSPRRVPIVVLLLLPLLLPASCMKPMGSIREAGVADIGLAPGTQELLLSVGGEPPADKVVLDNVAVEMLKRLEDSGLMPDAGRLIWTYSTEAKIGISLDPALTHMQWKQVIQLVTGTVRGRTIQEATIRVHPAAPVVDRP